MASRKRKAPPGCYWRGHILWGRLEVNGQERRWSLETDDPAVAAARRKAGKDRIVADTRHGDSRRTVVEVIPGWAARQRRKCSAKTVDRYLCSLDQLSPWFEGKSLAEVDGRLLAVIIREREAAGVTNATIKRDLVALSSVMNYAIDECWIEANPVLARMKRVEEKRDPIILPRGSDIDLVVERAPGMVKQLVAAAMATGAREEELLTSQRSSIDHHRRQMTIHGKRNKVRTISLDPFEGFALLAALPAYVGSSLLFWHSAGESYKNFASQFAAIVKRADVFARANAIDFRGFRFHDLRHWHAIEFLKRRCGSIYDLQHRLGHASVKTTEGYLRAGYLTHDEVRSAMHGQSQGQEQASAPGSAQNPAQASPAGTAGMAKKAAFHKGFSEVRPSRIRAV